jgi:hypothetical protein
MVLKQMVHMLRLNNEHAHNPYATMAQTTDSAKQNIRKDIFSPYCGITDNAPTCMYTGIKHTKVTCAHILPKSTKMKTITNLALLSTDVNSPRNLMWLCRGIEEAFDSMKLSFVSILQPGMVKRHVMLIWDTSCMDYNLGVDTSETIRDVFKPEKNLDFNITRTDGSIFEHHVFKRCLANQAIWCHNDHHNEFPKSLWSYGDFSSVNEEVRTGLVNNEYMCSTMLLAKEIEHEIEEEIEEEDK